MVTDEDGDIVAGDEIASSKTTPRGQLAGSFLAHAELNALAGLDPVRRYGGHVLHTTLEPCALCVGAAIMVMIGGVRFASNDVYAGGSRLSLENPHTARQPLGVEGPLDGIVGDLGELLDVAHFLWRKPDSIVVDVDRERSLRIVEIAERVDLMTAARDGATLDDAIALVT